MKYIAKQVDPEFQGCLAFNDFDSSISNFSICGNGNYLSDEYEYVENSIFDIFNHTDIRKCLVKEFSEFINNPENGFLRYRNNKPYSKKESVELKKSIIEFFDSECENDVFCKIMSILLDKECKWTTIRGCCQSEWANLFYHDMSDEAVCCVEAEYFNMGTEWNIEYENGEGIMNVYCYESEADKIKKEIADCVGCDVEDLRMFEFDGYDCTPRYREVG